MPWLACKPKYAKSSSLLCKNMHYESLGSQPPEQNLVMRPPTMSSYKVWLAFQLQQWESAYATLTTVKTFDRVGVGPIRKQAKMSRSISKNDVTGKPVVYISRAECFSAGHRLHR